MNFKRRQATRFLIERVVHVLAAPETIECCLADVSATGARLVTDDAAALPEEFLLQLSDELQRWCRIRWRNATEAGVQFIAVPCTADAVLL